MAVKLVRNIRTSERNGNPRVFLEPHVLEQAGFEVGEGVQYTFVQEALVIQRAEGSKTKVSKRKRKHWPEHRPLIDHTNKELGKVLRVRERVDILVSEGQLVIRRERSFDLCVFENRLLEGTNLKKLRLGSFPSGAGAATGALMDTGFYEPVFGLDMWDQAIETYNHNFTDGFTYWGDLRNIHPDYLPHCDVAWLSPECKAFSGLGKLNSVSEGLGPHFARVVLNSGAKAIMIEQVPSYFKSTSFQHLKQLLRPIFPYWEEVVLDAWDFGSVAGRKRGYAVAFQEETSFAFPEPPKIPNHKRATINQVIGKDWETGDWRTIENSTMEGILNKTGNNNFTPDKNPVLVDLNTKRISCIVGAYRRYQVTSSYLRNPDDPNLWRPFRSDELSRFLSLPGWFEFPEFISESTRTQLIGQSIDGEVVRSIGIEVATALMESQIKKQVKAKNNPYRIRNNQLEFRLA